MHNQGALAYQQTAKTIESPREREAALLVKAAAQMQKLRENWSDNSDWSSVLNYNRKIWTIFVGSVTAPDSPLPQPVRQNIANLGLFVLNQTREMTIRREPELLDPMIAINRQLAAGLRGQ